jgi:hypothetical protein
LTLFLLVASLFQAGRADLAEAALENVSETAAERIERRIGETKTEIVERVATAESRLVWKMFGFWLGQTAVTIAAVGFAAKMILLAIGK